MQNKISSPVALGLVAAAVLSRLLPHPANVTPLTALVLFGGASFSLPTALVFPVLALGLSDLVLGAHATAPFVGASFVATAWLGSRLAERRSIGRVGTACLASSIGFFVLSNFGVWLVGGLYPHSVAGLSACYVAALPFFRNSLAGDLVFTAALFSAAHFATRLLAPKPALA